jgi:iron complex transport system substrate-binding protein
MFQDQWYVPQGESWAALFIKDAHALYLWQTPKELAGFLPFEVVLKSRFLIAPGDFSS